MRKWCCQTSWPSSSPPSSTRRFPAILRNVEQKEGMAFEIENLLPLPLLLPPMLLLPKMMMMMMMIRELHCWLARYWEDVKFLPFDPEHVVNVESLMAFIMCRKSFLICHGCPAMTSSRKVPARSVSDISWERRRERGDIFGRKDGEDDH